MGSSGTDSALSACFTPVPARSVGWKLPASSMKLHVGSDFLISTKRSLNGYLDSTDVGGLTSLRTCPYQFRQSGVLQECVFSHRADSCSECATPAFDCCPDRKSRQCHCRCAQQLFMRIGGRNAVVVPGIRRDTNAVCLSATSKRHCPSS